MPVVVRQNGFRIIIYSNEHPPPHVHVIKGGGEAVFSMFPEVELRESIGMKVRELKQAKPLVKRHEKSI